MKWKELSEMLGRVRKGRMEGRRGVMEDLMISRGRIRGHPDEEVVQVDPGEGTLTGALLDLMMAEKARAEMEKSGCRGQRRVKIMKRKHILDGTQHS